MSIMALVIAVAALVTPDFALSSDPPPTPTYYATVEKIVDNEALILSVGQSFTLNYTVIVTISATPPEPGICAMTLASGQAIQVKDTMGGFLGKIYYSGGPGTYEFSYPILVGPYEQCAEYKLENTACIEYNPTPPPPSCCADLTVAVSVPCDKGCTLTPGYWKTHSSFGPAPYDDTWDSKDGGAAPFLATGLSYYQALWAQPAGGNAYFILAHAYIAAELNALNGADIPTAVLEARSEAGALLVKYQSTQLIPKKSADRLLAIELSEILDAYNNGYTGPGHCSE